MTECQILPDIVVFRAQAISESTRKKFGMTPPLGRGPLVATQKGSKGEYTPSYSYYIVYPLPPGPKLDQSWTKIEKLKIWKKSWNFTKSQIWFTYYGNI